MSIQCTGPQGYRIEHTHFYVESDAFWKFLEHFFQRGEGCLNEVSAAVALKSLDLEVSGMLHTFAHIRYLVFSGIPDGH